MKLHITKMHGIGNDFLLIDDRNSKIENHTDYPGLAAKLCDRHFGIGADGLIVINSSMSCDIKFRIFNMDGSEPEMCGNGIRCFGKYIYEKAVFMQKLVNVETLAGKMVLLLDIDEDGIVDSVQVNMGSPILNPSDIPCSIKADSPIISHGVLIEDKTFKITPVSMGNPHCIVFVEDDPDDDFFFKYGPALEKSEYFPKKTNVEFVNVLSKSEIRVRVWERGVGETLACGTGACASAVASMLNEKTDREVYVHLKGGSLNIRWDEKTGSVFMKGPAVKVFETTIEI